MAKNNKGGLGRGLNSLLGSSTEEALSPKPAVERDTVILEDPIPEREVLPKSEVITAEEAEVTTRKTRTSSAREDGKAADERGKSASPIIEISSTENDHVVIKEVKERRPNEVPLDSVYPNPDQPRTNFKKDELEELASSIERDGLLQPILVRSVGEKYQIIAGERRWQACKQLGISSVPIRIRDADDDKALELALVENIQRSDLNPIEEAYGYRRLMDRKGLTQSEIAIVVSKGRSTVANALRLLELPEEAQQLLFEEKISAGHARAILSIPSKEGRQKLTDRMVKEKISVREAETIARLFAGVHNKENTPVRKPTPKAFKTVARELRESLKTNVKVKTVQGKNKIEIEFKDEEELERLYDIITSV